MEIPAGTDTEAKSKKRQCELASDNGGHRALSKLGFRSRFPRIAASTFEPRSKFVEGDPYKIKIRSSTSSSNPATWMYRKTGP